MNQTSLTQQKCQPCEGVDKPLTSSEINEKLKFVSGWTVSENNKNISREWLTKNFMAAIEFMNRIAKLAEDEGHHPDMNLSSYRRLRIDLSTHAIGGLSGNDFILAAKIDQLPVELKK